MRIALLSFFDVDNFGANLQLISTYHYLKGQGHVVMAVDYQSHKTAVEKYLSYMKHRLLRQSIPLQRAAHHAFLMSQIDNVSPRLYTCSQVASYIKEQHFDGVIIGSDAVVQHWPLFSTLKFGKHRPMWIEPLQQERRFPNPFWGIGYADVVPTAMMSVSSQNSKYYKFSVYSKKRMARQLKQMTYISVRDEWTREMMHAVSPELEIEVTPDPVFALNQNIEGLIPCENTIRTKFDLPKNYVLIGLRSQVLTFDELQQINEMFKAAGKECVAFSIDGIYNYKHPFSYQIPLPLSPLEWFALIKYASAYIGSNMHPIVSCLTNAVPCYSLDNWGTENFWGQKLPNVGSSKVYDVLSQYGLLDYYSTINNGQCMVAPKVIVDKIESFPINEVSRISSKRLEKYNQMMERILQTFNR